MRTLKEVLLDSGKRPQVVADCVKLIDSEVANKRGLSGVAIKGAFAIVKKIRPAMIDEVTDHLLPDFTQNLEGLFSTFQGQQGTQDVEVFFCSRTAEVANALLNITDQRAQNAKNGVIKKAYERLRPLALRQVEEAVPGLARLIHKYV